MRGVVFNAPGELALASLAEPVPTPGQAVVEVATCGICGSDLHSFRHGLAVTPGQVMGHEFSGTIVTAPGVDGIDEGDRVTVRPLIPCGECARCSSGALQLCEGPRGIDIGYGAAGAMADRVLIPRAVLGQTVFKLPDSVDDACGALAEPLAVALHGLRLAAIESDDIVVVIGAGMIGLGVTRLLAHHGAQAVIVIEPSARRRQQAAKLGADLVIDPITEDVTAVVRGVTGAGGYGKGARADVIFECSGSEAGFASAVKCVRQGGRLMLMGIYGHPVTVALDRIVDKEIRAQGAIGYRDEFAPVIELMEEGVLRASDFVSHSFALSEVHEAFAVQGDAARSLKVQLLPET